MDELRLDDVLFLGGSKEDFEMLKDVDEPAEDMKESDKQVAAVHKSTKALKTEVGKLVNELGLASFDHFIVAETATQEDDCDVPPTSQDVPVKAKQRSSADCLPVIELPQSHRIHNTLLVTQEKPWHEQISNCKESGVSEHEDSIKELMKRGQELLDQEVHLYQAARTADKSSDSQWLMTVFKSGTLSDKTAARAMLLQESCLHNKSCLDALVAMAKKKGKREALGASDSLRHIWIENVLPNRKLRYFRQRPLSQLLSLSRDDCNRTLLLWCFEDFVKEKYKEYLDCIQVLAKDPLPNIRNKLLGAIFELLCAKPEEEQRLLTLLVNKLGDPDRKVASQTSFYLSQLVAKHPNMKMVVVSEVERLLYRSNVSEKAQYYAICFLNQLVLSSRERNVAAKLIAIYFSFFKSLTKETISSASQTKMLSALISGVNRAFPYTEGDNEKLDEQINMLFKITHLRNLTTSVQALMLLFQVMDARKSVSDRYYQSLYSKLLDHDLTTSLKLPMFLNLLYKSMKADPALPRLKAFIKRIMQACDEEQPAFVCGALFLVSEVIKVQPSLKTLVSQPEDADDEEHFTDIALPSDDDRDAVSGPSSPRDDRSHVTFLTRNSKTKAYDVHHRNPMYSGAEYACAWETNAFRKHYHPSVSSFTDCILKGVPVKYSGDPLQDFTLKRFLDRFMYKNPKKAVKAHGKSIMQPQSVSSRLAEQPVNSTSFLNKNEDQIPVEERFFYKYFKSKASSGGKDKKVKKKDASFEEDLDWAEQATTSSDGDGGHDFASNIEKASTSKAKSKKRVDMADDSDDMSDQDNFDYADLDDAISSDEDLQDDESTPTRKKRKWTDEEYEKALLENLSSESDDDQADASHSVGVASESDALFASAEKFSHLLEDTADAQSLSKQEKWELSMQVPSLRRKAKRKQHGGKTPTNRASPKITKTRRRSGK